MSAPCELKSFPDHVTVILHPSSAESSWADVEAFGMDVRHELERRQRPACVVDLSPLTYMGSSVVALLVQLWKDVQSRQGRMVVVCGNPMVLEVLRIAGLDKLWNITAERTSAERQLGVKSSVSMAQSGSTAIAMHNGGMLYFALGAVAMLIALMVALLITAQN